MKGKIQVQLRRGELPLESTNCQLPKGPTPNLQITTFRNSMPVSPLKQSNLQPYEHRHCATQPSLC